MNGLVSLGIPAVPGVELPHGLSRPRTPDLVDRFGRRAVDLRVSLTDRCNLRCSYCMPAEGLDWLPGQAVLADAEVNRLIRIAVEQLGVNEVRFTGGEPLLRRGLEQIVAATKALSTRPGGPPDTSVTTNGLGLSRRAAGLKSAGLDRVNVSLDTLRPERFAQITRRDRLGDVLAGLHAARDAGLDPIKINAVLLPGVNDDEAPELLAWALAEGYEMRFIEQMPLDAQGGWERSAMVTAEQILASLHSRYDLEPAEAELRGSAPAQLWYVREHLDPTGGRARVGVIASVSAPFCGDCDRTRLTADGQIRSCLFSRSETDLRALLRAGADDEEVAELWRLAMWGKQAGHGIDDPTFLQPARPMSAIGG